MTTDRSCVMNIYVSPRLALQVHQQVEDLRLNGHVQRRDRLVADDELRIERQRAGDADALAAAAVQLVRIGVDQPAPPARPCPSAPGRVFSRSAPEACCG